MADCPSDDTIRQEMESLMKAVDLEQMSTKQFIAKLSQELGGVDLSSKKKFIKRTITEIIDRMQDNDVEEDESDDESSEEEIQPKKGGLNAVKEISDELMSFLGCEKMMARTAVVKKMWEYIKEKDLQNPNDRREILLDKRMKSVFDVDSFTMFTMNKYIGAHIHPYKPVDLTTSSSASSATTGKRNSRKDPSENKKRTGAQAQKKTGVQSPWRLSDAMVDVVGRPALPRPQVTQALWQYIRANNLQNPHDKREIICDEKLKAVMGGQKKVTMFSMNKYITPHMLEKLDKSEFDLAEFQRDVLAEHNSDFEEDNE